MAMDSTVDSKVLEQGLTEIADAIRGKTGTDRKLAFPGEMAGAVETIRLEKPEQQKAVTLTENGTVLVQPDPGKVLCQVEVTAQVIARLLGFRDYACGTFSVAARTSSYTIHHKKLPSSYGLFLLLKHLDGQKVSSLWKGPAASAEGRDGLMFAVKNTIRSGYNDPQEPDSEYILGSMYWYHYQLAAYTVRYLSSTDLNLSHSDQVTVNRTKYRDANYPSGSDLMPSLPYYWIRLSM